MDTTAKDTKPLHRVKRAYTKKVNTKEPNVHVEGADVGWQYDDEVPVAHAVVESAVTPQQAYALRVWDGQSPDVPVIERCARVVAALRGQNLPCDVVLPDADAHRHIAAYK